MTRTNRYLAFAALGLAAVLGVAYCGLASFGSGMCGNKQIAGSDSPDRRAKVVVFERDCGATTDFSTQVVILPPGRSWGIAAGMFSWSTPIMGARRPDRAADRGLRP